MKIIQDGIYKLSEKSGSTSLLVSGSLGGGTATLGYTDSQANFIPLTDGAVAVGEQYQVNHGAGVDIFIQLVGSIGADLEVLTGALD